MKKRTKKLLAGLLAVIMLLTLLPMAIIGPFAEEVEEATYAGPALNETIVGTVNFQSFNFLGKNETGDDGVDYKATFYYTDDYFSHSAINENVTSKSVPWTELDDASLATASMDLAAASYATGAGDVVKASTKTWANTDYSDRAANAREFLTTCGFEGFEAYDYDHAPTRDSIAYVLANKKIHVWDEESQSNKDYTLVAVGVRGAGYGSEWASNVEVGDPSSPAAKNTPHQGFHKSAEKVVAGVKQYIADNNIDGDVKYWVSGFSRAAAVANLTAAYITDRAEEFSTAQKDIYGYTYECPQAAPTATDALQYKNIHNIVNAMDVVPMVSPSVFEHQRLGIDYVMPYYKNTTSSENTMYYNRMYDVLKTIAVGTTYKDGTYEADRLIADLDPSVYPYNRPVPIYTIKPTQLISDAINGDLMNNFGTATVSGSDNKLGNVYLDEFLNNVLKVCMRSGAWDRSYSTKYTTDTANTYLKHKERYAEKYQTAFMNAFDYLLDFSGPAFLDMIDAIMGAIGDQLALSNTAANAGFGLAFLNFYEYPQSTYKWGVPPFIDPWVGKPSWVGNTRKDVLISEAQPVVRNVVHNMVSEYEKDGGNPRVSLAELDNAMNLLVEVLIDLYADELSQYNSNYFGTTLHYLFNILSMHEQETVLSWITALDDNHINRGYRTLTLPANTNIKLLQFREQFEGSATFGGDAPVVAEYNNGDEVKNLDQRIYAEKQGDNLIIRYPASLDIRADVTTLDGAVIDDLGYQVADYQTKAITTGIEDASQYAKLSDNNLYTNITNTSDKTNAKAVNDASNADTVTLGKHDTFQLIANGTSTFDNSAAEDKNVYDTHLQKRYEVTWQNDDGTVLETSIVDADALPVYNGETPVKVSTDIADYTFSGWSPEVVAANADTTYTAVFDVTEKVRTGHSLSLKGDIGVNFYYYIPESYDHDLKLAFKYKGETTEAVLESVDKQGFNYRSSFNVVAAAMTEPIEAVLTCGDEVIDQQEYSVKTYADSMINNDASSEKLKRLCKALLNYGGKAQIQFDYRMDDLANKDLGEYTPVSTEDMIVPGFDKESLNNTLEQYGLSYYGSSLVLRTETSLKLYFKKLDTFNASVPVTINGQAAEFVADGDSYVFVKVADIQSSRIANTWTITIGDTSFDYSTTNYIQNTLNGSNDKLKDTVIALYDYYKAAVNFFGY